MKGDCARRRFEEEGAQTLCASSIRQLLHAVACARPPDSQMRPF